MKRAIYSKTFECCGRELAIQSGKSDQGCYREILVAISGQLAVMLSHHSRVLVVRFDLHMSYQTEDNKELSRFLDKIRNHYLKRYGAKRMGYLWAREQEKAKKQHYHVALILDGNRIQHPSALLGWISARWENRNHPRPFVPENCFYNVKRANSSSLAEPFYRLSYLAKTRGKGYRATSANDYSTSRVKPKLNK